MALDKGLLKKLSRKFKNAALLLGIKGESRFKYSSYIKAAELIDEKPDIVAEAAREHSLEKLPGIGKAIAAKIQEFMESGSMEFYEKLTRELPEPLLELTKISGLGHKKIARLHYEASVNSLDDLRMLCESGEISKINGFSKAGAETMLNSIEHVTASKGRYLQQDAREFADAFIEKLSDIRSVTQVCAAGEYRRATEIIAEIPIVVNCNDINKFKQELTPVTNYNELKPDKLKVLTDETSLPVYIYLCRPDEYVPRLHVLTGSEEFSATMRRFARDNNIMLDENVIIKSFEKQKLSSEKELYQLLDLQYIEPELRESGEIISRARTNSIPQLLSRNDMQGMLHVHSSWSDGRNSIEEMALQSLKLGFNYFAICDHSQSAAYAGGLTEDRIIQQQAEIDKLNSKDLGIQIIKGIESDILPDGSLDYPPDVLREFELVVASVHSNFKMPLEEMTARFIKAIENEHSDIIGHPTGRLLMARPGYHIDTHKVIDCAAANGKIMELNCNPYRLDLPYEEIIYALDKGVKIAINPDSHKTSTLSDVFLGVSYARKAGASAADVVNCLDYEAFRKLIGK